MGGQLNDVCDEGTDINGQKYTYIGAPQISVYARTDGSCMHGSQVNVVRLRGTYLEWRPGVRIGWPRYAFRSHAGVVTTRGV